MARFVVAVAAVCLAALVAVAVAQVGEEPEQQRLRDAQCRREVQESPLDACRQVMHRQLTAGGGAAAPFEWSAGVRLRCCQQLQDVSRECRCAAVRRMMRGYEQAMPPLEEGGGGGSSPEQGAGYGCGGTQQGGGYQQGCPGTMAGRGQQQGGGYYGGAAPWQGGERCRCSQQQQGGGGYCGGAARRQGEGRYRCGQQQQQGGGYSGETGWQQGGRRGETSEGYGESGRQQQRGGYYGEASPQQGRSGCGRCPERRMPFGGAGAGAGHPQQSTRVGLRKVRQYAARLPAMCQVEPQECSIFSGGEDY
ncbi:hypothetical protein ACP4OV_030976 [Aristida adscensionis]